MNKRFMAFCMAICMIGLLIFGNGTVSIASAAHVARKNTATLSDAEDGTLKDGAVKGNTDDESDFGTPSDGEIIGSPSNAADFYHEENVEGYKVTLSAKKGILPADTTVTIKKVTEVDGADISSLLADKVASPSEIKETVAFDITFYSNGKEIEPENGSVQVSIDVSKNIAENVDDSKNISAQVFHIENNNNIEELNCDINNNEVVYDAKKFTTYGILLSQQNVIEINTTTEFLKYFQPQDVNKELTDSYKLTNDIDVSMCSWKMVKSFGGTLDGNGHTLKGLTISTLNNEAEKSLAMFGTVYSKGSVKNLKLDTLSVKAPEDAASIALACVGEINNCAINGSVSAGKRAGGFIVDFNGSQPLEKCEMRGTITGGDTSGGIVAEAHKGYGVGTINDCINYAKITFQGSSTSSNEYYVGGVAGTLRDASVSGCSNYGDIEMHSKDNNYFGGYAGGIIGYTNTRTGYHIKISDCNNYANIFSSWTSGGIVGYLDGPYLYGTSEEEREKLINSTDFCIINCNNEGNIKDVDNLYYSTRKAGIIGVVESICCLKVIISYCSNKGEVENAGIIYSTTTRGYTVIDHCDNKGSIEAESDYTSTKLSKLDSYVCGGIIAESMGGGIGELVVNNCSNSGEITVGEHTANSGYLGGIGGFVSIKTTISQSYNVNSIHGKAGSQSGGIASVINEGKITDCFNAGAINIDEVTNSVSGGLIGSAGGSDDSMSTMNGTATIQRSYNAGDVGNPNDNKLVNFNGNIIGRGNKDHVITEEVYYLENGIPANGQRPVFSLDNTFPLTDAGMKTQSSFKTFDFNSIWKMGTGSYNYPVLSDVDISIRRYLNIENISLMQEEEINQDEDINITFDKDIGLIASDTDKYGTLQIREYDTDKVVFEWGNKYINYLWKDSTLTLKNALSQCENSKKYYLYIPYAFVIAKEHALDNSLIVNRSVTNKNKYSFTVGVTDKTVTFVYNLNNQQYTYKILTVAKGGQCGAPSDPVKSGYIFDGWYENSSCEGTKFDFETYILHNYTLYGKFTGSASNKNTQDDDQSGSAWKDSGFKSEYLNGNGKETFICYDFNHQPLIGYHRGLYRDGQIGSFYFDENGIMLVGWQEVYENGQKVLKYFDERKGHEGFEITAANVIHVLNNKSAYKTLGGYTEAAEFADQLSTGDIIAFGIDNNDEIKKLLVGSAVFGDNLFLNNKDWSKQYIKAMINNIIENNTSGGENYLTGKGIDYFKQGFNSEFKTGEFKDQDELLSYIQKETGSTMSYINLVKGYNSNMQAMESLKSICPSLATSINELEGEYKNSVKDNLKKDYIDSLSSKFNARSIIDAEKSVEDTLNSIKAESTGNTTEKIQKIGDEEKQIAEMSSQSNEILSSMISTLVVSALKDSIQGPRLSSLENVIYSVNVRTDCLNKLQQAEANLKNQDPKNVNQTAYQDYLSAFNLAKEATIVQYENMEDYYNSVGNRDKMLEIDQKLNQLRASQYYSF